MTTFRTLLLAAASAASLPAVPASAQVLAGSSFAAGDEGWLNGDFDVVGGTSAVAYDPAGAVTVTDNYGFNAFVAPSAYLGDKSAAFGGAISFQLAAQTTDGRNYAPLALFGAGLRLYAGFVAPPAAALTGYSVALTGANFSVNGDPFDTQGTPATDAQLLAVLSALDRLAIQADWRSGADLVTLDNVVLRGPDAEAAVPEPATWACMILGSALVGAAGRRRQVRVAFG